MDKIKKIISTFLLFFIIISGASAQDTIYCKPELKEVTIFNFIEKHWEEDTIAGSQLFFEVNVTLNKGINTVIFQNLPDFGTFQLQNEDDLEIISTSKNTSTIINKKENSKQIEDLKLKTEEIEKEIHKTKSRISIYKNEKEMILSNKTVGTSNQTDMVQSIRKLGDFYRQRIQEIEDKLYEDSLALNKLSNELKLKMERIEEIRNDLGESSNELIVLVLSDKPLKTKFNFGIYEHSAIWTASYELKVKDVHSPLELHYFANIRQNSGIDWKNVKVKLSSGRPNFNSNSPDLKKWNLEYVRPSFKSHQFVEDIDSPGNFIPDSILEETFNENITTFYHQIPQSVNILTNKETQKFEITTYRIPAIYEYLCIPKLNPNVYLTAKISDWAKYKFIDGPAELYIDGVCTGMSDIKGGKITDTLSFSLGQDKGLLVERKRLTELNKKTLFSGKKVENVCWEISILNHKKSDIELIVKDQIPISQEKELKVEQQDISGAEQDKQSGILQWKVQVKPSETKKLLLKYQVSYPKDKIIIID